MNNQNKTRFAVGMPVIYIYRGIAIEAKIKSLNGENKSFPIVAGFEYNDDDDMVETFNYQGLLDTDSNYPSLFTLPEYEALKALTDSFVNGTFAKRESVLKTPWHDVVDAIVGKEEQTDLEQNAQPTTETTDLLENGQPIYFCEGMEVGCIYTGAIGKVSKIAKGNTYSVVVNFEDGRQASYTGNGAYDYEKAQVLYPIEQYNAIQLPKLKPIQVAKPKEDVIELPSWFKGGATITPYHISTYVADNFTDEVKNKASDLIMLCSPYGMTLCNFYQCNTRSLGACDSFEALIIDFTFDKKYYTVVIDTANPNSSNTELLAAYSKNGKDISEKLC